MTTENRTEVIGVDQSGMTRAEIEALFAIRQRAYDSLDAATLASHYSDDAVIESPISGRHGKAEAQQNLAGVFRTFLDIKMRTDALMIDGGCVTHVLLMEGTNLGGMFGLLPSGKSFKLPGVFLYEMVGGKIIRERRVYDFTGLLVQVGVLQARPAEPLA